MAILVWCLSTSHLSSLCLLAEQGQTTGSRIMSAIGRQVVSRLSAAPQNKARRLELDSRCSLSPTLLRQDLSYVNSSLFLSYAFHSSRHNAAAASHIVTIHQSVISIFKSTSSRQSVAFLYVTDSGDYILHGLISPR